MHLPFQIIIVPELNTYATDDLNGCKVLRQNGLSLYWMRDIGPLALRDLFPRIVK
jgi:hypothetical protein